MKGNRKTDKGKSNQTKTRDSRPTIGLLINGLTGAYVNAVWSGVVDAAAEHDANLLCFTGGTLQSSDQRAIQRNLVYEMANAETVDGLVIVCSLGLFVSPQTFHDFCKHYHPLPMTGIGMMIKDIPGVLPDYYQGMREAIVHLIEVHGHRRIAFIRGPKDHQEAQDRYRAYVDALNTFGIPLDHELIVPGDFGVEAGMRAIRQLLDERDVKFDAVAAAGDSAALGAMEVMGKRGIRIPDDVAVVGFGDIEAARFAPCPLTTARHRTYKEGRQATEMLLALLKGQEVPEQVTLPTELVVRQSCGCSDPAIAQVMTRTLPTPETETKTSNETLETVLTNQREEIVRGMEQVLVTSKIESGRQQIERLLDALASDLETDSSDCFPPALDETLHRTATIGADILGWQRAISHLLHHVSPHVSGEAQAHLENLGQQAQIMIGKAAERIQAHRRIQAEEQNLALQEIGRELNTLFNMPSLVKELEQQLPQLGIPSCYLSLYQDVNATRVQAELILAYDRNGCIQLDPGERYLSSHQLVPPALSFPNKRYTLVIKALHSGKTPLGFILFEIGPREGIFYDKLSIQIASALHGVLLFEEREQVEAALARERDLLQTLLDNSPDQIFFKDRQSRLVRANAAHWQVIGADDPQEAIGKTDFDLFPQQEAQRFYEEEQQIMESGEPVLAREWPVTRSDGETIWVSEHKLPIRDETGEVIGLLGISRDITIRKETEAERETLLANIRQSETLLRSMINATPDWIFIKDLEHRYVLVNESYAHALHLTPDDFVGQNDLELGFPEELVKGDAEQDIRGFWADERQVVDSGKPLVIPRDLATVDGEVRVFNTIKVPLFDAAGEVWSVLGIARDVTEREQLLSEREKRSKQLQTAAEVSHAASSVLNLDDLIQQVVELAKERFDLYYAGLFLVEETENGNWAILRAGTGEAGQEMLQQGHKLKVGGDSMIGWCVAHQQARIALDTGAEAVRFDNPLLPLTRSELALPLNSRGQTIGALTIQSPREAAFGEDDIAVLQTMADQLANAIQNARLYEQAQQEIAERKRAEKALARQAQALDAELEQIFFVVSHHLQEPLRMIVSYSQLLKQRYADKLDPDADELIGYAIGGATRIQALVNDLLAFSRVGTRQRAMEPINTTAILERTLSYLKFLIEQHKAVIIYDDLPNVIADEVQMTQLFQNLIHNAIKFRGTTSPEVHIGAERGEDGWVFSVRDNGIGIKPQYTDRIFRLFQRLHGPGEYPGTGVGLAICKKIVERHGGRIWVESEPGKGATFFFTIPDPNEET